MSEEDLITVEYPNDAVLSTKLSQLFDIEIYREQSKLPCGLPKYYICPKINQGVPELCDEDTNSNLYLGPGINAFTIPQSLPEWYQLIKTLRRDFKDFDQNFYIIDLLEKRYSKADLEFPIKLLEDSCALGNRSVTVWPDGKRFFFHLKSKGDDLFNDIPMTDESVRTIIEDVMIKYGRKKKQQEILKKGRNKVVDHLVNVIRHIPNNPILLTKEFLDREWFLDDLKNHLQYQNEFPGKDAEHILKEMDDLKEFDDMLKEQDFGTVVDELADIYQVQGAKEFLKQLEYYLQGYSNNVDHEVEFKVCSVFYLKHDSSTSFYKEGDLDNLKSGF